MFTNVKNYNYSGNYACGHAAFPRLWIAGAVAAVGIGVDFWSSAYGAFLLERYTRWNEESRQLDLYYLLSFGSPYQVQVMHTTLRLLT